ncbi:DUF4978 domain-containing protein [Streptomyces tuirus]|uniref:DUF4978 domain-containing protein n=1 Tax=Streptomyces tuirus TaxID=68278 RepID=A0A941FIF6_9ACTN|nr:DUF4978 domain-containing protein [Streptomyces tuirus]
MARRHLAAAFLLPAGLLATALAPSPEHPTTPVGRQAGAEREAAPVSYVDTSKKTYDKHTLMVDGKPFFHSGVQFRYEHHKYTKGWTDAQLEPVMKMISEDGFDVVNIPIWWSQVEPEKGKFRWRDIDRYLDWSEKYGLKLELLWFGHESTGHSIKERLPEYATRDFEYVLKKDGTPLTRDGHKLLDKTDPDLLEREKYVLGRLMDHVAERDTRHTMVGAQILNEPNVANMQWGASADRSYSPTSNARWEKGGWTDAAAFRKDVLLDYLTELGRVVKASDHSVYTRVNTVGDAEPVTENEALRAKGEQTIDFFGDDPYSTDVDRLYGYGADRFWAQGGNFPMIMENFAGHPDADVHKFNAVAGNTAYNLYAATDSYAETGSSNLGLYDFDPETHEVKRKAVSHRVARLNRTLGKIATDLASRAPVERGGSTLQTFNRKAATTVDDLTKPLDGVDVTFSTDQAAQGVAVRRGPAELALTSTAEATYRIPGSFGAPRSVETGYYNADDRWVRKGKKRYSTPNGNLTVQLAPGEAVRVLTHPGKQPPSPASTRAPSGATPTAISSRRTAAR